MTDYPFHDWTDAEKQAVHDAIDDEILLTVYFDDMGSYELSFGRGSTLTRTEIVAMLRDVADDVERDDWDDDETDAGGAS